LVIAGTGSAAVARVGGQRGRVIGGRGFLLGDDGSIARVGAEAIRAALRAHDGGRTGVAADDGGDAPFRRPR